MHLVIGGLVNYFLNKPGGTPKTFVPSYKNIIELKHLLPGRVRFRVPKLIKNDIESKKILKQAAGIDFIHSVSINELTGSLLIKYDPEKVTPDIIFFLCVKLLGLEEEISKPPKPLIVEEVKEISTSLNRVVYEKSNGLVDLKTLIPISFAAYGVYKLATKTHPLAPGALTLLYWAYRDFSRMEMQK